MGRNQKPGPITRAVDRILLGPEAGRKSGTNQVDEELHQIADDQSNKDKGDPK